MQPLLSRAEIQQLDRYAIDTLAIAETTLMEHAALGVMGRLRKRFSKLLPHTQGLILAGGGNNGGDALAVGRILVQNGEGRPEIALLSPANKLKGGALCQHTILKNLGYPINTEPFGRKHYDWIVDGLFGTGLSRAISGNYANVIEKVNATKAWVVAIDIPSGLCADTGRVLGMAIQASETVSLGFLKKGLVTHEAADYVGRLTLKKIQLPLKPKRTPGAWLFTKQDAQAHLPQRRNTSHKGDHGHVYVWAGTQSTQGASILACLSALATGAGRVTLAHPPDWQPERTLSPEIMTLSWKEIPKKPPTSNVVLVIGPGMGVEQEQKVWLEQALESEWPLVLDADALTLIAQSPKALRPNQILTPHPGEAARLLGSDPKTLQANRYQTVEKLSHKFQTTVLLKGKGTLIKSPGEPSLVTLRGNTTLAKAGSGDTLSGILGTFLGQGMAPHWACATASWLHGRAAELASQTQGSQRTPAPTEVLEFVKRGIAELETGNPQR